MNLSGSKSCLVEEFLAVKIAESRKKLPTHTGEYYGLLRRRIINIKELLLREGMISTHKRVFTFMNKRKQFILKAVGGAFSLK